jgi:replicative DNA helicase
MSLEAEQNLIGCAIMDNNFAVKLLEIPEEWFSKNEHKLIYRELSLLVSQNLETDMFALYDSLKHSHGAKNIVEMAYINDLAEQTLSFDYFNSYKTALFKSYKRRNVERVVNILSTQLKSGTVKIEEMISFMQDSVFELLTDHNESKPESIDFYMKQVVDDLTWQHENPGVLLGKQTGFKELDETLGGFEPGKIYVVGGRPGMGKTQFAVNLALRISKEDHTMVFSLEMPGKGLAKRALSNISNLPGYKIDGSKLRDDEWTQIAQAAQVIKEQNKIYIDETPGLSTAQIRARLKAHEIKFGSVGCIVVDHIGLIKKNPKKSETEALAQISHELQAMSKEFNAPLIELVQLNRGVESREDKRPGLNDIKQTSAIEEDARVIMFPYRDEYYKKEQSQMPGITELIIAKNSDGETKSIYFKHDMARARYETLEGYCAPEPPKQKKGNF